MPIFEYRCHACAHEFEVIVFGDRRATCPQCQGEDLEKRLSTFAVSTQGERGFEGSPAPCGRCGDPRGAGACSMN
jgi:putative FmdB family regulatory protein